MPLEYTNLSIARRIEFYNFYFAKISTKKGDFIEVVVQNWQSNPAAVPEGTSGL
jgi:hypothetical protein